MHPNVDISQACERTLHVRASYSKSMPPEPCPSQVSKWGSTNQHPKPKEAFGIALVMTSSRTLSSLLPKVDAV
jgi:hypothetical protein